ncbi:MAG: DUF6472 family protein [Lachnospiraceae bacterium]|nr:DUF6472 family protein [Lachnospiraceae bacterium]
MSTQVNCETCDNFIYDEEYDEYYCRMDLDEDEYGRVAYDGDYKCPYYRFANEYEVVWKQI